MRARIGVAVAILAAAAGCAEDEVIDRGRADSGVAASDGGLDAPLFFKAGMKFSYRAELHRRMAASSVGDSAYAMTVTLTAVDDRGSRAASTLTYTATGARTSGDLNWDATDGFDSWVGRLGPSEATDRVASTPVTADITRAPSIPAAPPRKALPPPVDLFLDLRRAETIRSDFASAHAAIGPSALSPEQHPQGRWALLLNGTDSTIEYYDASSRQRYLSLEYDPRGFLVQIVERIGNTNSPSAPNGTFQLTLVKGPE